MVESVNSSYSSGIQSNEDKKSMFSDWRKQLQSREQMQQGEKSVSNERKSPFMSNTDIQDRPKPFLSNDDIAKRETPFLTNDIANADRQQPFLSEDNIPAERPEPFLQQPDVSNTQSPLELPQEQEAEEFTVNDYTLPKNDSIILAELKRNPMHSTMTIRDIADEFELSYQKATDIYKTLNEDSNGVVREFNLPDRNATVSYLV